MNPKEISLPTLKKIWEHIANSKNLNLVEIVKNSKTEEKIIQKLTEANLIR